MLPSVIDMIKEALTPMQAFNALGAKVGVGMAGAGGVAAVGTPIVTDILGATLDEWKVYTMVIGSAVGVAGVMVQIFFKWLERRDRLHRYHGPERRRS